MAYMSCEPGEKVGKKSIYNDMQIKDIRPITRKVILIFWLLNTFVNGFNTNANGQTQIVHVNLPGLFLYILNIKSEIDVNIRKH
jgi:hypothetical protein